AAEGVWIVAQVIDDGDTLDDGDALDHAEELLVRSLGVEWPSHAEINRVALLPHGHASDLIHPINPTRGRAFGPCSNARSPVIRYHGRMSFGCNEAVIMGRGPRELRRECRDGEQITTAIAEFEAHAFLRAIGDIGPGPLTLDPRLSDL